MPKATSSDYQPQVIEPKWQKFWEENRTYEVDLEKAPKPYYNLMMFPYPSAEGLHVGNMYAFTGSDIWGRYMRLKGNNVFEPIGLDGFGIHSENYALKVGKHPQEQAKISEKNFYRQLKMIGNQFSWQQKLETYDPKYYRWTQWIFIQLFKAGLAYRKKAAVNWCPSCKTVLADEQVIEERCERCSTQVNKKELEQWFFKITNYSERLLANLERIDWSQKVKIAQKNWIGKAQGIEITYPVVDVKARPLHQTITCFTTRPDTNFGATFLSLAPEHPILDQITSKDNKNKVSNYKLEALKKSKSERMLDKREKTGVFTGSYVINQLNGKLLPVYVSDFVLPDVGSGAVVGVPGHDMRDFEFAKKFNLPIIRVVVGLDKDESAITKASQVQEEAGKMVNSQFLDGMEINKAIEKMTNYLINKGWAKKKTIYHLRDWLISRQRYWGPPIPMVNCPQCGWQPVKEEDLPVLLPDMKDWRPKGTGRGPLAQLKDWVKTKCPRCGGKAQRETDVSDTFLDSSWYFLRYPSVQAGPAARASQSPAWDPKLTEKWLPVNMYIGGAEHSVLHLLYARFLTMFFYDQKLLDFEEPFTQFRAHGLIIKDGHKMSKSKGNIVTPDQYILKFGADSLRCYLMFLGPLSLGGDFRDSGMVGMHKFLRRVYKICEEKLKAQNSKLKANKRSNQFNNSTIKQCNHEESFWINKTIKRVTEGIERLKYNTSIASLMEYINFLQDQKQVSNLALKTLILLIAPFAPHLAEELWFQCQGQNVKARPLHSSVHQQTWPKYDPQYLQEEQVEIIVQVNGKLRDRLQVEHQLSKVEDKVVALALNSPKLKTYLQGKTPKKTIFVTGKLLNFVV